MEAWHWYNKYFSLFVGFQVIVLVTKNNFSGMPTLLTIHSHAPYCVHWKCYKICKKANRYLDLNGHQKMTWWSYYNHLKLLQSFKTNLSTCILSVLSVLHVGLAKLSLATFLKSIIATLSSEASNEDNVAIIDFKKVARESNIGSADLSNLYQLLIHILRTWNV